MSCPQWQRSSSDLQTTVSAMELCPIGVEGDRICKNPWSGWAREFPSRLSSDCKMLKRPLHAALKEGWQAWIDAAAPVHDRVLTQHVLRCKEERGIDLLDMLIDRGIEHAPAGNDTALTVWSGSHGISVIAELFADALTLNTCIEGPNAQISVGIADACCQQMLR